MKKLVKDIGKFSVGSLAVGGGAAVVGKAVGGSYAGGLAAAGGMLPAIGGLVVTKHIVRKSGDIFKVLPKQKKQRVYKAGTKYNPMGNPGRASYYHKGKAYYD